MKRRPKDFGLSSRAIMMMLLAFLDTAQSFGTRCFPIDPIDTISVVPHARNRNFFSFSWDHYCPSSTAPLFVSNNIDDPPSNTQHHPRKQSERKFFFAFVSALSNIRRQVFRTGITVTKDNNKSNNSNDDGDPLKNLRTFYNLPLQRSCWAIASYLCMGVVAYRWFLFPQHVAQSMFSLVDALYFSVVCLTTIGYGDMVPLTNGGKLFCSVFGMSGILLWSSAIATIGSKLVQLETDTAKSLFRNHRKQETLDFYEQFLPQQMKQKSKENDEPSPSSEGNDGIHSSFHDETNNGNMEADNATLSETKSEWKTLLRSLIKAVLVIVSGGCLIGKAEGWNWIDSIYYSFMTATTIGFGDLCPQTSAGKWLAIGMIPVLLAAFGELFATVGLYVVRKRTHKLFQSRRDRAYWMTQGRAVAMDFNGDGRVSKAEFVLYILRELGTVGEDEIEELKDQFARFDVTQSGYIEAGDLLAMKQLRVARKLKERKKRQTKHRGKQIREKDAIPKPTD